MNVGLALLFLLSGCDLISGGGGDSESPRAAAKKRKRGEEVEVEEAKDDEEYSYNPIGKRDPFRSFLSLTTDSSIIDDIPRTPLQRYDIEQYELTGIIWGIDRPRALVEDPEGIGHVMEMGTYIGKNWGKVTQIEENSVVITEEYTTMDGELVVKPIELRLRNDSNSSGF